MLQVYDLKLNTQKANDTVHNLPKLLSTHQAKFPFTLLCSRHLGSSKRDGKLSRIQKLGRICPFDGVLLSCACFGYYFKICFAYCLTSNFLEVAVSVLISF